jgi:hypothetical protein
MGPIEHIYDEYAAEHGLEVVRNAREGGLIPSFEALSFAASLPPRCATSTSQRTAHRPPA